MTSDENAILAGRGAMTLTGLMAGLAAWLLIEILPDLVSNPHVLTGLIAAVAVFLCSSGHLGTDVAVAFGQRRGCLGVGWRGSFEPFKPRL
ncbi:hypothetical protein [uncultured Shimia sp.]|uniref:hypothetical protein n=1 Tax=uncultured Shimia sp. TaxID=573152 RepID=UPI002602362E|nr:hypothetical protein [uncultured Shimia sp.]